MIKCFEDINEVLLFADSLPLNTVIGEFSGKDSVAAIIKAVNMYKYSDIILVASFCGKEVGNHDQIIANYHKLKKKISGANIHGLIFFSDFKLWKLINENYIQQIEDCYGFHSACIGCHMYFHILRAPIARKLSGKIITGERESHDGRVKINQSAYVLDSYKKILNKYHIDLVSTIREESSGEDIDTILGNELLQGNDYPKCTLSSYRDDINQDQVTKFVDNYLKPVSKAILDSYIINGEYDTEAVSSIIKKLLSSDNNDNSDDSYGVGRILFYDTRDNVVFHDTGEKHDIDEPFNIEEIKQKLAIRFGSLDNMKHIKLPYGFKKKQFNNFTHVKVIDDKLVFSMKDSKYKLGTKNTLNDRWHALFEDVYQLENNGEFNTELIKYFYNDYINYNFKALCQIADPVWLSRLDIVRTNAKIGDVVKLWGSAFSNKHEFAIELLEKGFIFPVHVKKFRKSYKILDGYHRKDAIDYLFDLGLWDDRKILALNIKHASISSLNNNEKNYMLDKKVIMHIPKRIFAKYSFLELAAVKDYDDYVFSVEVTRYIDAFILARMYMYELSRIINKHKEIKGVALDLHLDILNDEVKFNQWLNS